MKHSRLQDNDPVSFQIPYYSDYISPALARHLLARGTPVAGVNGLLEVGKGGGLENPDSLRFLVELYRRVQPHLARVLKRRQADRKFIDERVRACFEFNRKIGRDIHDVDYKTVIGLEDSEGRVVVGPKGAHYSAGGGKPVAPIPEYLQGPHVTLFGPPDSAKMAINAMNAWHRKLKGEPAVVEKLLVARPVAPKWGADDEDSKTPIRQDLLDAAINLTGCFNRNLELREGDRHYRLASENLSAPIKRFPGLALPCTFLFLDGSPLPLHMYDFALHLYENWRTPEALCFYVPKLENEEEAAYIHDMITQAEAMIREMHPQYQAGTVRLMIVLENPRAILRAHEIMDALYPYFAGASLGWHDYLGSTARLFKEDGNYRIPVKADPNIVIKYIKASHSLLADVVGSRGGIKVGGMYGILPVQADLASPSFQVTLKGFFKDVITQMKRDLTGFWVAHPDFVRLGIALVQAWERHAKGDSGPLAELVDGIFTTDAHRKEVMNFIHGPDMEGLDPGHPNYVRSLLVADIKESDFIANNHPDEIRYNVFQSLQYLTDWLCGNGCVALPTVVDGLPVRVMDDLATAERSRWEVWHEIRHGRFKVEEFLRIAHEEMRFIRKDLSDGKKIVQVKYDERTAKWYPVAFRIMILLMTSEKPVEFAPELLMPFTVDSIRQADDPWSAVLAIDPEKYTADPLIERWNYIFERISCAALANDLSRGPVLDPAAVELRIKNFTVEEIREAAGFHGDIGEAPRSLDHLAKGEQKLVSTGSDPLREELRALGQSYLERHGFKFLVSAQGKSGEELLAVLKKRIQQPTQSEIENAREALWQIARKRISASPFDDVREQVAVLARNHGICGVQVAVADRHGVSDICEGLVQPDGHPVTPTTLFEIASLSKSVASAFALEYFSARGISLDTKVNELLRRSGSPVRLQSSGDPSWAEEVSLTHLMSHSAMNMHYVKGVDRRRPMPRAIDFLASGAEHGYEPIQVVGKPGSRFRYSGGGFIVLEHLIEALEKRSIEDVTRQFLDRIAGTGLTFGQHPESSLAVAAGLFDHGQMVPGGRLNFPAFAAGALGSARGMITFLRHLQVAFKDLEGSGVISHDTAVCMLRGRDLGAREFMGCDMGLGVFVAEMGANRVAIHQGANEGFRAIYLHVVDGPDCGKGFVILCNADNCGVLFIAEVASVLIKHLNLSGLDMDKLGGAFDLKAFTQEQIVNAGYKQLLFSAFQPTLPGAIERHPGDKREPLWDRNLLGESLILSASNQRFARAENLVSPYAPVFDPMLYDPQGKVMDSWETSRHNDLPCDFLELRMKRPGQPRFVRLSTEFHDGNQAPFVRILGRSSQVDSWHELLPMTAMDGHSERLVSVANAGLIHDVRIEIHPDGGLSRVGLYEDIPEEWLPRFKNLAESTCARHAQPIPVPQKPLTIPYKSSSKDTAQYVANAPEIDWASAASGATVLLATNEHYGPAAQVISPFPAIHMFDGLESARSRKPGHYEEVVIRLGKEVTPGRIVFDFQHFVNNNPRFVQVFGKKDGDWRELTPPIAVKAFAGNLKEVRLEAAFKTGEILVRTLPDGGINRLHVFQAKTGE